MPPSTVGLAPEALGIDTAAMRRLDRHESQAFARSPRLVIDLGDALLLHDPDDPDPLVNRASALRLPDDAVEFARRLDHLIRVFDGLQRRPHLWLSPAYNTPDDLERRLGAAGFLRIGAAYRMLHAPPGVLAEGRPVSSPGRPEPGAGRGRYPRDAGGVRVMRLSAARGPERVELVTAAVEVLVHAFEVDAAVAGPLAADLETGDSDICVLFEDDRAVAAGRRFTVDGVSYLSSIGTRPDARRRGYASRLTRALVADARSAGNGPVYLGVDVTNTAARRLYEGVGFRVVGAAAADLLLP